MQEDKTLMHYVAQVRYILQVVGPIRPERPSFCRRPKCSKDALPDFF